MRAQRSGRIFNISSMAGYIGGTHYPVYAASKFAVEGFSESLAAEVSPVGIFVTLVEPGFFRTDFLTTSVRYGENTIEDYRSATIANRAELAAQHRYAAGDRTNERRTIAAGTARTRCSASPTTATTTPTMSRRSSTARCSSPSPTSPAPTRISASTSTAEFRRRSSTVNSD
jgi:NAD(P)-dependent dehydrogenase (short-subunit alcohol dehydrogenase family)